MSDRITLRLVNPQVRARAARMVMEVPDGYCATIGPETRTQAQNRHLWPLLEDIRRQVPGMVQFTRDDIKLQFLNALGQEMRFLPTLEGDGLFPTGYRSSTLTKKQFADLLELVFEFGARKGVRWSRPPE